MLSHHQTLRLIVPVLLLAAACKPSSQGQETQLATTYDSAAAQRDSVVQQLAYQARTLADVSAELAQVQVRNMQVSTESPAAAQRDSMIQTVRYIVTRVNESDAKLRTSARQIRNLTHLSDSLRTTLEATITSMQATITAQQEQIALFTATIDTLRGQNVALTDTVANMSVRENTVYFVVGTREQLKQKGLVTEEGGARVLWILWKTGTTLQSARELDPAQFTPINKRLLTEIPLPHAAGRYRILSRQDQSHLATPRDQGGRFTGPTLRINTPEEFWRNSKFLIILQEEPGTTTPAGD
jgi:hypothetical protein